MGVPLFDAHCDTVLHCWHSGEGMDRSGGHLDLERGKGYDRYCQFFALFTMDDMAPGKTAFDVYEEQYALFRREMERNRDAVTHCTCAAEARKAHEEGKIAAFLSVEGAHSLNCDIDTLREAYRRGVRAVNLTWNNANLLSGTNVEEPERGLSGEGRAFVAEMERLGMLVDVSHLSDAGFWDVIGMATRPILASHSNSRALCPHPRNLTDEQFLAVVKNGGVVGLNLCREFVGGGEDVDALIRHLDHFLALGGEKTVALGGDLDGCTPIDGIPDVAGWKALYQTLLARGYGQALVDDLFFHNLMRLVNTL